MQDSFPPYPKEFISFDEKIWKGLQIEFDLVNENLCFSENHSYFMGQDILYIYNKKNDVIIDVGCYNDSTEKKKPKYARFPKDYRFLHYTINVVGKDGNWSNPIEKILVPTSFELKAVVEGLLKKYENYENLEMEKYTNTSLDILEYEELEVRLTDAQNPQTNVSRLIFLSKDIDYSVVQLVAKNPNTPKNILKVLAKEINRDIRCEVANNPNILLDTLKKLSKDSDKWVRGATAMNSSVNTDILRQLSTDTDEWVRGCVAISPNTPFEILTILAKDEDKWVRGNTALNQNISLKLLGDLIVDKEYTVRFKVICNPNISLEMLNILKQDKDERVRKIAQGFDKLRK